MPMTPKQMIKHLEQNGFVKVSQVGSHVKLINYNTGKTTIVANHTKDLPRGTEQKILKQAGLK